MCIRSLSLSLIPVYVYLLILVVLPVTSCPGLVPSLFPCLGFWSRDVPCPVARIVPVFQASESATLVNAITSECHIGCVNIASFWFPQTVPHQYLILPVPALWSIDCLQPPTMSLCWIAWVIISRRSESYHIMKRVKRGWMPYIGMTAFIAPLPSAIYCFAQPIGYIMHVAYQKWASIE